jgi:membrane dipeptidase
MISARTQELLQQSVIWDNHAGMPIRPGDTTFLPQLQRYRSVGATFVLLNVAFDLMPWHHGFKVLATMRAWLDRNREHYLRVEKVEDIHEAKREGKLGVAFNLEGACAVDDLPELVEPYYALGVRWMLIAYNRTNRLGGGCHDDTDPGLTPFGKRVIDEMQRVGMILCCTHTGYRTAREAMEYSSNPVIFSHSNPRAVHDHPRNIPDDLIKACAATRGVVNINGVGLFLGKYDISTGTIVRHIQYVADLVGPEYVGLGLDYCFDVEGETDGFMAGYPHIWPPEWGYGAGKMKTVEPERIPAIAEALLKLNWSERQVAGLLGENNLRVARQVWK